MNLKKNTNTNVVTNVYKQIKRNRREIFAHFNTNEL